MKPNCSMAKINSVERWREKKLPYMLVVDFLKNHGYYGTGVDGNWSHPDQEWIFNFGYPETPEVKIHIYLRRSLESRTSSQGVVRGVSGLTLSDENNWINLCCPDSLSQLLGLLSNPNWEKASFWYHERMPRKVIQYGQEKLNQLGREFGLRFDSESLIRDNTRLIRTVQEK